METEDMMYWMLEEAKKSPMKISHDFDTRFRVWVEQIIPARVNAIRQCKGDVDYAMRMIALTTKDMNRLKIRVIEEATFDEFDSPGSLLYERATAVLVAHAQAIEDYLNEVKQ